MLQHIVNFGGRRFLCRISTKAAVNAPAPCENQRVAAVEREPSPILSDAIGGARSFIHNFAGSELQKPSGTANSREAYLLDAFQFGL
jgi:hypothetical protein